MSDAKDHYATLLGPIYAWSVSQAGDPVARATAWLAHHELARYETYLDLGAGFGAHTLALLRASKRVTAVDFDATLVSELRRAANEHASRLALEEAEMLEFLRLAGDATWDVVLCAGDTLTHLPTRATVTELLHQAARHLRPAGRLALAYRDSTRLHADGVGRFREVARDARRTMHCLLEPIDATHLRVTDIVTELEPDGPRTRLGDYVKLRLSPEWLRGEAEKAGLALERETEEAGMTTLVFRPRTP